MRKISLLTWQPRLASTCNQAFSVWKAHVPFHGLTLEITSSFSPVTSSRWLQGTKDPVHTWFKWQTSRKMLQLIRWKLCLVFLEKSRRCIYFLSKFTELLDQKPAQSLWNRFATIILVSSFCGAVVKLATCCWNYVFAARWVY